MFGVVKSIAGMALGKLTAIAGLANVGVGLKPIRYFIDSHFREQIVPIEGSVVYADLFVAVEHSGIYVGDGQISNIVVDNLLKADSQVKLSDPNDFTSKSTLGRKIYVSCDKHGAVGDVTVADGAMGHVGEKSFYGLVFKNCHVFSTKCVKYSARQPTVFDKFKNRFSTYLESEWEFTIRELKATARDRLGATKWRLWDWDNSAKDTPEPDWDAQSEFFESQKLTPEFIQALRQELADVIDYEHELSDEDIPTDIRLKLRRFGQVLEDISDTYDKYEDFLRHYGSNLSYQDLKNHPMDFNQLAKQIANNPAITDLVRKMGRNYISQERKKQSKLPKPSRSEVHGTHRSDDVARLLPSELVNLDDETLEMMFYARLLEKNLMCYELAGVTDENHEISENHQHITGPVVACLDTSGSMSGQPLLKAKALLFAIAKILKQEKRALYVILFGSSGQIHEYAMYDTQELSGLLKFLQSGFGGGTDFETPLRRAFEIIQDDDSYQKADILMISDGDCTLSDNFNQELQRQKQQHNCMVYSVLCDGRRVDDNFSDEIVVL